MPNCTQILSSCKLTNLTSIDPNTCFVDTITEMCGYNEINTIFYAIIAIISFSALYIFLTKHFTLNKKFIYLIIFLIVFGSSTRVITDLLSSKEKTPILQLFDSFTNGFYRYNFHTVTPGIYFFVVFVLLFLIFLAKMSSIELSLKISIFLALMHLTPILLSIKYPLFIILASIMTALPAVFFYIFLRNDINNNVLRHSLPAFFLVLPVIGHSLDGSATFLAIELGSIYNLSYSEQHVVPTIIGAQIGYLGFYLIKVLISSLATAFLIKNHSNKEELIMFMLAFTIPGLAPGLRSILRLMCGV